MIISNNSISVEYKNLYNETGKIINFPIFQRDYKWKNKQVENMLDDILSLVFEPAHIRKIKQLYFLDFIWYEEDGIIKIADGQQRCVTYNILILAINDYIKRNHLSIPLLKTFDFVYDDDNANKKCIKFFNDEKRNTSPFCTVYNRMTEFIESNEKYIEDIIDVLKNNVFVYFKQVDNVDDAFDVFTQINSGGKPLSKDDVIKSTINQYSGRYKISVDDYVFKDIKNFVKSYYKLNLTGNNGNFDNLAIMSFLNTYIVKDPISFKMFCDYLKKIKDINKHSIYNVIEYINKDLILNVLYAIVIQGIDINKKREYLEKVLLPLCLICIIWKIKQINPGNKTTSLFSKILEAVKANKNVNELQKIIIDFVNNNSDICKISKSDFKNGLHNLNRDTKKAILIMDVIKNNTSGYLNVQSINLEHIYPQNAIDDWFLKGWTGNAEEQKSIIDNIGNYILLPESVNKKIQNKYITDKVIEYNKIIPMDKMLQTKLNTVDFDKFETDKENYIYQREDEIIDHIQKDFFFGKVLIV